MKAQNVLRQFSKWVFIACGFWLIALGGYFMFLRPPLLPEDLRYLGSSATQVEMLLPHLASWLQNVFTVMGGFMAGCGVLIVFVSLRAVPQYVQGTGTALGITGLFTVATMSGTNFALDSDFKWLLLVPTIVWLLGLVCHAASTRAAHAIIPVAQINDDSTK